MGTSRLSREEQIRSERSRLDTRLANFAQRSPRHAGQTQEPYLEVTFFFLLLLIIKRASLVAQMVNNPPVTQETGSVPGSRRSRGEENGYSLQSCLENSRDRGARWATVHGVAKSLT